jgi:hypothetical protein
MNLRDAVIPTVSGGLDGSVHVHLFLERRGFIESKMKGL